MAMGKRRQRQESLFIMADGLPKSAGHPFYQRLNALLAEADFDRWIERRCQRYYNTEEARGQPSIPPGVYFRMLLVGYFEGIDSQRGIAWRCADSLSLRQFLGIPRHGRRLEAIRHAADARGRRDRQGLRADGRRSPPLR
jgi:transposase